MRKLWADFSVGAIIGGALVGAAAGCIMLFSVASYWRAFGPFQWVLLFLSGCILYALFRIEDALRGLLDETRFIRRAGYTRYVPISDSEEKRYREEEEGAIQMTCLMP